MQENTPIVYFREKYLLRSKELILPPEMTKPPAKQPSVFDPGTIFETFPQGKEIIVVDAIIPRYASLTVPIPDMLKFENIKTFYKSIDDPKNERPCYGSFRRQKLFRYRGFIFEKDKLNVLSQKPPASRLDFDDPCDCLFRVFVDSAQDVSDEELNFHSLKIWLFHVWLKKNGAQPNQKLSKHFRKGQQASPCRLIFDPGENTSSQTKNRSLSSTIRTNSYPLDLRGTYYLCLSSNINLGFFYFAGQTDLRTNPFQLGEDDVIMTSKEPRLRKQLEPEEETSIEEPGILKIQETRKTFGLKTTLQHLLHIIPTSLTCADPTTLVVIQAM